MTPQASFIDLTGRRFGRLIALVYLVPAGCKIKVADALARIKSEEEAKLGASAP